MTSPSPSASPLQRPLLLPLLAALVALAALVPAAAAEAVAVPAYIHVCKNKDPDLPKCIVNSTENLQEKLASGMPELGVPPLEPLYLKQLVLNQNPNFKVTANDIRAYGSTHFKVHDLKVKDDKTLFDLDVEYPQMNINGTYTVDGRVLLLPVKGSGPLQLNLTGVRVGVELHCEVVQRDGESFLSLRRLPVTIRAVRTGSLRLDNLFDGDPILGEVVNSAINANFATLLDELKPEIQRELEREVKLLVQGLLNKLSLSKLFPD